MLPFSSWILNAAVKPLQERLWMGALKPNQQHRKLPQAVY
jgi:hypothetical protein